MDILIMVARAVLVLVLVLVVLGLFGVSPAEAGRAVGDAFSGLGDFFESARDNASN